MNKSVKILILILSVTICVALVFLLSHAISSPSIVKFQNQYRQKLSKMGMPQSNNSYEEFVVYYEQMIDMTMTFQINNRIEESFVDSVRYDYLVEFVPKIHSKIKDTLDKPTNWGAQQINRFYGLAYHIEHLTCMSVPSPATKGLIKDNSDICNCLSDIKTAFDIYTKASKIAYWTSNHTIESARQTIKESQTYLRFPYIKNCDKASALSSLPPKIAQNLCQQWNNDMSIELQGYAGTYTESQYNELKSKWSKILLDIEALKKEYPVFASGYNNLKTCYNTYTSNANSYYQSQYSNNTYRHSWN